MDLANVRVDAARAKQGEWIKDIPGLGDVELQVRGLNSPQYRLAQAKAQRSIPRGARREGGFIDPEAADIASGQALAEGVLLGWKNISVDGVEMAYSAAAALGLLTDPNMAIFRDAVEWAAGQVAILRKEDEDAALGK